MSPEGIAAAKRMIGLRLIDRADQFSRTAREITFDFSRKGAFRSSAYIQTVHRACKDELPERTKMAWEIVRSILDREGFISSEDNLGQILSLLVETASEGARDVEKIYADARKQMEGSWDDLKAARTHAVDLVIAEVEIDFLGRKARRPPLEDELSSPRYAPVREHWRQALANAIMDPPNLPNAVKEGVHALEALGQLLVGKSGITLGEVIKELRAERRIPVGSDKILEGLYAFANNAPGARHGSSLPARLDEGHWGFFRTTVEGAIRLLLDVDTK